MMAYERGGIVDGQFAEGFAVEADVGGLHAGHKSTVGDARGADGRIDAV